MLRTARDTNDDSEQMNRRQNVKKTKRFTETLKK